ncbi:hypothetical protein Tco_0707844 [Tanacetum coccineum]
MDMNSLIHSTDSSDEGKTSSSGSDSSQSSVNNGHEMVLGRGYGVVLRWFRVLGHEMVLGRGYGVVLRWFGVVGMVRPREWSFGRGYGCGLEMVSGRGYGVVLRWFRVVGHEMVLGRGHCEVMVWVMGMVGSWEDHRYSEVLKGTSVYDFVCMPSLDKGTVREEPHGLDNCVLGRVADDTTLPTPAPIPRATPEQIRDDTEFAMEDNESLDDVSQAFWGVRRTTRASSHASRGISEDASHRAQEVALDVQPQRPQPQDDEDDGNGSDGNVDLYYEARVGNTIGDVLERDLLPLVPGRYYIPYPYDEGSDSDSLPYTIDYWEAIHEVNLGLRKKELYKDPKVCRTALDRFPTPAEVHRLRELSLVELSDRMSVLQCQVITHGNILNARYDHSLRNVDRLTKRCSQQMQTIKRQNAEVVGMVRPRDGFRSWALRGHEMVWVMGMVGPWEDHRYSEVLKGLGRGYESISVGVERGLRMDRTDEEFKELSQRVDGFILDAQKKFDGAVAAFSASTFPFLDKVSQNSKSSLQDIARLERDKVDSCLLKACAIEHSKDEDVAVEVVLDEIIPNLPAETRKVSSPKNGKSTLKIYEVAVDGAMVAKLSISGHIKFSEFSYDINRLKLRGPEVSVPFVTYPLVTYPASEKDAFAESFEQEDGSTISSKTGDKAKESWDDRSEVCSIKIFAIKTLVKSYQPVKDAHLRVGIDELLKDFHILWIRASAKAIIRLSKHWDKIPIEFFHLTLRTSEQTLVLAMNSVVDLRKEVEVKEKDAEEVKEKAAEGCSDILSRHAGEVCAEKAILATELKELQLCLFTMSDERNIPLANLDELKSSVLSK